MMRVRDCAGWVLVALVAAAMLLGIALIADLPFPDSWVK